MTFSDVIITVAVSFVISAIIVFIEIKSHKKEYQSKNVPIYGFTEKAEGDIRVMTFNVRCSNVGRASMQDRIDLVCDTVLKSDADSCGVQEATPEWMNAFKTHLGRKYAYVGVGREGGKKGEYSAIFYLKSKWRAVDSGTFWLSETPNEISKGWDSEFYRICTWAILENKKTGEQYYHLNSHFDHIGPIAREESVDVVLRAMGEHKGLPCVFTADANIREHEHCDLYKKMVSGVMADTKYTAKKSMEFCTFHNMDPLETNKNHVIDYVMINNNFKANEYRVVTEGVDGCYVSDHYPVYADLSF